MTKCKTATAHNGDVQLWRDFESICDTGGRLSGTESEVRACELLAGLGRDATGVECQIRPVPFITWRARKSELFGPQGQSVACQPLVRSASTNGDGLKAEVIDLGRGIPEEFAAHAPEIPGRIVMVRHELMFSAGTIHRRFKYRAAVEAGAVGFLIVGPLVDSPVAGSSGRGEEPGIPAMGISQNTATMFKRTSSGRPSARMIIEADEAPAHASNLMFDMPGQTDEWVVLSAHIDGHDLAESAIDNASGLAVILAVARNLAPQIANAKRGLRLAMFNVEEWALTGSAHYVASLPANERDAIILNVNVDSVGLGTTLTALTSGFSNVEPFLLRQAEQAGVPLDTFRPLQMNSDHGNFAEAGIPAFRLVAGFNDPSAATRFVLTTQDTRDKVTEAGLHDAVNLTRQIVLEALQTSKDRAASWRLSS